MAYRFAPASNPILRAAIGAFSGYELRDGVGGGLSGAALLKRNGLGTWQGIHCIDNGAADYDFLMEFDPTDHLNSGTPNVASWVSAQGFADTTDWMIVGFTWDGTFVAGGWNWRWKIGTGAWSSEAETAVLDSSAPTTLGAGYRHMIGNVTGLTDDADYDIVCIGAIKGALAAASFQTLDMAGIASWDAVFTGANAWLLDFQDIAARTDRTGNGGNEVSRSAAGITLVADPAGWSWGGGVAHPNRNYIWLP